MGVSRMEFLLTCLASACVLMPLNPETFAAPIPRSTPHPIVDSGSLNTTASSYDVVANKTLTEKKSEDGISLEKKVLAVLGIIILLVGFCGCCAAFSTKENKEDFYVLGARKYYRRTHSRQNSPPLPRPPLPTPRQPTLMPHPKQYGNILPEDIETFPQDHPFLSELATKRDTWEAAKHERVERLKRVRIMSPESVTFHV